MASKWNWTSLGAKIFPLLIMAVNMVERISQAKGKAKQDAAIDAITTGLAAIELSTDRDLLHDAAVEKALRGAIDAYVNLQNVIAAVKAVREPDLPRPE